MMVLDVVKLMPPELVPYAPDIDAFQADTRVRLIWPPIGIGGGGTVVAAQDKYGADLAIKIILADTDAMRDQVQREANILRQVQHAAALSGQGVLWQKHYPQVDLFFLAMELVEGQTLAAYLDHHGTLDEVTALEWSIAIAEGLEAMHRQKVIHRDVKPDNIILAQLGSRYQPILVDYGIAKVGNHTARGAKAATDGYAPPEQYTGGTDQRSDIYALGATLFEMVTGRTPPKAIKRDAKALLEPRQFNASLSPELEVVIQIATACDPDQRFSSMGVLLDALRLVESGDRAALYAVLHALGLVQRTTNQAKPVSVAGAVSAPQLPPLPMKKKAAPRVTPTPASAVPAPTQVAVLPPIPPGKARGGKQVACPYCQALTPASEMFCADCGYALVPGAPVGVAKAVSVSPAPAPAAKRLGGTASGVTLTPQPQFLSLLMAKAILLGGPGLSGPEKILLLLSYWLLFGAVLLGGRTISVLCDFPDWIPMACLVGVFLLFGLFAYILSHWNALQISRRGKTHWLRRSALLLVGLLSQGGVIYWLWNEVAIWHNTWILTPPPVSVLVYLALVGASALTLKGLLS